MLTRAPLHPFDFRQAQQFIAALTGAQSTILVLQFADDTSRKNKAMSRVHVGSLPQLTELIGKMNGARAAVWMQVNSGRRGKQNVTSVRACFIDDDGKSALPPLLRLPPSIVVGSSAHKRNRHYYWLLTDGQPVERWPQIQKHLALFYDTDRSMVNPDRVMRLPGTWNMHGPCEEDTCAKCKTRRRLAAEPVTLIEAHPERRYTYEQILAAHPLKAEAQTEALTSSAPAEPITDAARATANRIGFWLCSREIAHDSLTPISFRLKRCPFNPAHVDKFMIRVQSRGGIWAGCWHDSCGGNVNRWSEVKDRIGGWGTEGTPFVRGDDIELAQRLLSDVTGQNAEAPVGDLGKLWRFDASAGLWRPFDDEELYQTVARYAGQRVGKRAIKLSHGQVHAVISSSKMLAGSPGFFGEAPPGVAFTNGVLLATPAGTAFVPHAAENRLNLGLPYDYDASAKCDRWRSYLAEVFDGDEDAAQKIDVLQEFLGACLVGIAPRFQKALLLYGMQGDNGKSVFTAVSAALFPEEVRQSIKPQDWGKEYYAAALAGARLNVVSEVPETDILSGDTFKAMISGDRIDGRFPGERAFNYEPVAGHMFACNRLPGTSDHTNGFWKRFAIVEFNRSFPIGHPMRDNNLKDKIIAGEMPGIAAWAVAGAARLLARDAYTMPASHERLLRGWKADVDSVAGFLDECCDIDSEMRTPLRELYPFFQYWCSAAGRKAIADSTFGRRLRENKIVVVRGETFNYYGVMIKKSVQGRWPILLD